MQHGHVQVRQKLPTACMPADRLSFVTALDGVPTLKLSCRCMAWALRQASVAALGFSSNLQLSDTRHRQTRGTVSGFKGYTKRWCCLPYKLQLRAYKNAPIDHATEVTTGQSIQHG